MTYERFKALLLCKLGFHDWNEKLIIRNIRHIDECGIFLYESCNEYKTCKVCLKAKRIRY